MSLAPPSPVLYSSTVILCEWDHSQAHPPQQHNLCWDGDQADRLSPQWSGHSQLQPYTRYGSILPRCILLHHTNSCRMRIEHNYIDMCTIYLMFAWANMILKFSPASKLKLTISYWLLLACRCKIHLLLSMHTDLQPYLLFADGDHGTIYRSNLNASGIQQLVRGLSRPIALDFDYR